MKSFLRDCFVGAAVFLTVPLWLAARIERWVSRREGIFQSATEILSLIPGRLGIFLRRGFFRMALDQFAHDGSIGFGTLLAHPQARIGSGVYVGARCTLGRVVIDDDVTIGSNVDILSG